MRYGTAAVNGIYVSHVTVDVDPDGGRFVKFSWMADPTWLCPCCGSRLIDHTGRRFGGRPAGMWCTDSAGWVGGVPAPKSILGRRVKPPPSIYAALEAQAEVVRDA